MRNNKSIKEMSHEDWSAMSPTDFVELVKSETFRNLASLAPVSKIMDGEDIREVTVWCLSFGLAWAMDEQHSSVTRKSLSELLKKAAGTIDAVSLRSESPQN